MLEGEEMTRYWNESYECMPVEQLRELQLKNLKETVQRVYERVPFYRRKFQELGLTPFDVQSLEDLQKLPFTTKIDLRENYPYDMFAEPLRNIVRIHGSSGTTGKPVVDGYTRKDLNMWSEIGARSLVCADADRHSVVQNAYGYGLFTGGLGIHGGAERLGASIIPISAGNTARQIMMMQDFGTTHLTCTPSYAQYLGESIRDAGIDPADLNLKSGVHGAEAWSESMRQDIQNKLGIKCYDIYGLSEICGPGVAVECQEQNGLHIWEDNFIPEIIDPDTGMVLPDGEYGELCITTITKEGMPLIRYRTRDISTILSDPCPCGRTHRRIARLQGRTDDMLIIRGVNVFPSQIEEALLRTGDIEPNYLIVVDRQGAMDSIEVQVELSENTEINTTAELDALEKKIKNSIHSITNIHAHIVLVEPKSLPRSEGKAVRVVDKRQI